MQIQVTKIRFDKINSVNIINLVDSPFLNIDLLLDELKSDPSIAGEMKRPVVPSLSLCLEEHSRKVLGQYETYFSDRILPQPVTKGLFRLLLALHDIGKPRALAEGDKSRQHSYTSPILRNFLKHLDFDSKAIKTALALLSGDPLGRYIKMGCKDREKSVRQIRQMSKDAEMQLRDFWPWLLIYYQADAGAYTTDAGWRGALDDLFVFDRKGGQMTFSPSCKKIIDDIEAGLYEGSEL